MKIHTLANNLLFPLLLSLFVSAGAFAKTYYVHNDHLGTPKAITAADQTVVWKSHATPFGENIDTTGTLTNHVRFPGQYYDQETGLHYNYYRYYDPSTGRYITSDPIGLRGGINTYGYVSGNPINGSDPSGLLDPRLHNVATYYGAAHAGLPIETAKRLGDLAEDVDFIEGSQNPSAAAWHAMCQAGTNQELCRKRFFDFIRKQTELCTEQGIARASHALQDFFAGGHRNFPQYAGLFSPSFVFEAPSHVYDDIFPGEDLMHWITEVTQRFVEDTYKRCKCIE